MTHSIAEQQTPDMAMPADTTDLQRCLWLTHMAPATRSATRASVKSLRDVVGAGEEVTIETLRRAVSEPAADVKSAVGARWSQVASDVRRALRVWDDPATRTLACRLKGRLPDLTDAIAAARLLLSASEAPRAVRAVEALARSQQVRPSELPATLASIDPVLRAATPETFGVSSIKSLGNKRTLVRKAVRLVDPLSSGLRTVDKATLPLAWRDPLERVCRDLPEHATSQAAILRRLAVFAAHLKIDPEHLGTAELDAFVKIELATHASGFEEKLRAAFRRWNAVAASGGIRVMLPEPTPERHHRLPPLAWDRVPDAIRLPLDAYLETAVSARNPEDWSKLVPDQDPDYADLGVSFFDEAEMTRPDGAPVLERGTQANWRNAVKRCWHAAQSNPRVTPKPATITDLFAKDVIVALVAAVRGQRRLRLEAEGRVFDPAEKGSYEHSLVEALCSVGRALAVDPDRLKPVDEIRLQLDPKVVGLKRSGDGGFKRVYAERRIGPRHARMLANFSEATRLKRWFEAPSVLWEQACKPIAAGRRPRAVHVALARSALIARIGQYVAPIRRTNFARLRYRGDDRHLLLPEGQGEGTLCIPAAEGKTLQSIHVRIDPETVQMLKYFIEHFLPVAQENAEAAADNPHLFPGAGGGEIGLGGYGAGQGFLTREKLNSTFRKHLKKHCELELCMHVMRHLAGKIILDQDPSAMALVQKILGHTRLQTTQAYYAEVCKIVAQRRYLHLLEMHSRKVLANVTFHFVDPTTRQEG